MDKITLGEIATALAFLVALGGSIVAIITALKKALKKLLDDQLKAIIDRLNRTDEKIAQIDTDACKNFLVQALSAADRGEQLTTEERMRLSEEFEHYTKNGGNSYIKDWHSRLHNEGKI